MVVVVLEELNGGWRVDGFWVVVVHALRFDVVLTNDEGVNLFDSLLLTHISAITLSFPHFAVNFERSVVWKLLSSCQFYR
jgi:hypothetical protein